MLFGLGFVEIISSCRGVLRGVFLAFITSSQEMEHVYSYNPEAHMGPYSHYF